MERNNATLKQRWIGRRGGDEGNLVVGKMVVLFLIWSMCPRISTNAESFPPTQLVLYQHEDRTRPGLDFITAATPSGNLSNVEVGLLAVFFAPLTEGIERNSTSLGMVYGQAAIVQGFSFFLTLTFKLNTSSYAGTISAQGIKDFNGTGEVAIIGGSGDFRFARGYDQSVAVSMDPSNIVFKNVLTIRYS